MLIARRFRHIFQHAQALLDGSLPLRRKLLPARQDIILDVTPLLGRQLSPGIGALAHFLLLLRRQPVELLLIPSQFLRAQISRRRSVGVRRPVRTVIGAHIAIRPPSVWLVGVRLRRPIRVSLHIPLRRQRACLPLWSSLLPRWLLWPLSLWPLSLRPLSLLRWPLWPWLLRRGTILRRIRRRPLREQRR